MESTSFWRDELPPLHGFQASVKEDGSWEMTWEGTSKTNGGTGKFKNIKGSGTVRGKATAQEAFTEWEGEVEY
jgi:hypothetical protein